MITRFQSKYAVDGLDSEIRWEFYKPFSEIERDYFTPMN